MNLNAEGAKDFAKGRRGKNLCVTLREPLRPLRLIPPSFCKLIVRIKPRHSVPVGDAPTNSQRKIRLLYHPAKVPIVMELVRGLVVMGVVVFLEFLGAPTFGPTHIVVAFFQTDRGHA